MGWEGGWCYLGPLNKAGWAWCCSRSLCLKGIVRSEYERGIGNDTLFFAWFCQRRGEHMRVKLGKPSREAKSWPTLSSIRPAAGLGPQWFREGCLQEGPWMSSKGIWDKPVSWGGQRLPWPPAAGSQSITLSNIKPHFLLKNVCVLCSRQGTQVTPN